MYSIVFLSYYQVVIYNCYLSGFFVRKRVRSTYENIPNEPHHQSRIFSDNKKRGA
jgi:hypothetical protein